jgi:sugar lactone lactonase YvrE
MAAGQAPGGRKAECAAALRRAGSLLFLVGCAWVSGCSHLDKGPVAAGPGRVWPDPPDAPRVAYVQSVLRPADLGIKVSALSRFGRWVTGSEKGNEPLLKPFGISLDEKDNLCLTDTGANTVCFYERTKKKWTRWERAGRLRFASPVAVAKREGIFFVADSALASVIAFDEAGRLRFQITNQLARPSGLAILGQRLFVADSQRHAIVVFDLQGNFQGEFGRRGTGPGQFNFPTHVAADQPGGLLITDSLNSRVQRLQQDGAPIGEVGKLGDSPGHFGRPKGAAADVLGHIYVIDALFDSIQIFDQAGRLLLSFGDTGAQPGQFWLPNGIAITRDNEIFVTDSYNHRIQVFKYIGPS